MWLMNIFRYIAEFIHITQLNFASLCSVVQIFAEYLCIRIKK